VRTDFEKQGIGFQSLQGEINTTAPGPLRLLLEDPNPKVSLSVLDLRSISYPGSFPAALCDERSKEVVSVSLSEDHMSEEFFSSRDYEGNKSTFGSQ